MSENEAIKRVQNLEIWTRAASTEDFFGLCKTLSESVLTVKIYCWCKSGQGCKYML